MSTRSRALSILNSKVSRFRFKYHDRSRVRRRASPAIARDDTVGTLALTLLVALMHREPWQRAAIVTPRRRFTTGHRGVKCRENNDARGEQRWQRGHTRGITVIICCGLRTRVLKLALASRSLLSLEFPFSLSHSCSVTRIARSRWWFNYQICAMLDAHSTTLSANRCQLHLERRLDRSLNLHDSANLSCARAPIKLHRGNCHANRKKEATRGRWQLANEWYEALRESRFTRQGRDRARDVHFAIDRSVDRSIVRSFGWLVGRSHRCVLRVHTKCARRRDRAPMYSARVPCSMARQHAESRGPSRTGRRDEAQPPPLSGARLYCGRRFSSRASIPLLHPGCHWTFSFPPTSTQRSRIIVYLSDVARTGPSLRILHSSFLRFLSTLHTRAHAWIFIRNERAIERCESIARVSIYSQLTTCLRALRGKLSGVVRSSEDQIVWWDPVPGIPINPHCTSIDFIDFSF